MKMKLTYRNHDTTTQQQQQQQYVVVESYYKSPLFISVKLAAVVTVIVPRTAQHVASMNDGNEILVAIFGLDVRKDENNKSVILKKKYDDVSLETSRVLALLSIPPLDGREDEERERLAAVVVMSSVGVVNRWSLSMSCESRSIIGKGKSKRIEEGNMKKMPSI
jgi:hypothetical protein